MKTGFKKTIIYSIFLLFAIATSAQTLKGRVVDDHLETLPYVSIVINDTVKVGKTDLNGFFQIDIPISVKKISFESLSWPLGKDS